MSQYFVLRQSTAATLMVGPFLDLTAGTTEEALDILTTEIWLSKNGGAFGNKAEATQPVHKVSGMYEMKLNTDDTDTVGSLTVVVDDTANLAIPVTFNATVVEEAIYDALYKSTATGFNAAGQVALITATQASIDAIEEDTIELQEAWTDAGRLDAILDIIAADTTTDIPATISSLATKVDTITGYLTTEVADILALLDNARAEPAAGAPAVNPDLATKIDYLYAAWRNKVTQTSTKYVLFKDDGSTQMLMADVEDDGTTFTRSEMEEYP